ncbi:hypothetical protein D3C81_1652130 [compost metagenome]
MPHVNQGLAARRASDGDVHAIHGLVDTCAQPDRQPAVTRQIDTEGFGLGVVASPNPHALDRPYQPQSLKLQRRLLAGPDQRHAATVGPRQCTCGHGARRRRAHGCQVAVIQQQGIEQTGAC